MLWSGLVWSDCCKSLWPTTHTHTHSYTTPRMVNEWSYPPMHHDDLRLRYRSPAARISTATLSTPRRDRARPSTASGSSFHHDHETGLASATLQKSYWQRWLGPTLCHHMPGLSGRIALLNICLLLGILNAMVNGESLGLFISFFFFFFSSSSVKPGGRQQHLAILH